MRPMTLVHSLLLVIAALGTTLTAQTRVAPITVRHTAAIPLEAPTPIVTRPTNPNVPIFLVSGQSNAAPLAGILTLYGPTRYAGSGGTPISAWDVVLHPLSPDDWRWVWPDLSQQFYEPKPDAFVWFQGESDATDDLLPKYAAAAQDLFARVRATAGKPDLLIVIVGLENYTADRPHWDAMRAIERQLAANDPRARYVDTMDLPNYDGAQHLDPQGYATLAQRIVDVVMANR